MQFRRFVLLPFLLGACREAPAPAASSTIPDRLSSVLDSAFAKAPQVPGLMLRVESPALPEPWSRAVGVFDRATKEPLSPDHSIRIASNTKTYVAAAVLRLVEQGKVGLDTAIVRYLAPASSKELVRGGYDPTKITVRQLLHHTSGIFDYAMSPQYGTAVLTNMGHRWTRMEQLKFAIDSGKPIGAPDEKYHYSDTGYILLGEIIERAAGLPLGQAVRELDGFARLGIRHTYFETLDSVPPGTQPRAHQYADTIDTYRLDASHDLYGGGGLVSTLEDLAIFYRSLLRGQVFDKKETLDAMLAVTPQSERERPGGYGMGIGRAMIGDLTCYGHSGYWGTKARYCPALDLTVVAAMDRSPDQAGTLGHLADQAISLMAAAAPTRKP